MTWETPSVAVISSKLISSTANLATPVRDLSSLTPLFAGGTSVSNSQSFTFFSKTLKMAAAACPSWPCWTGLCSSVGEGILLGHLAKRLQRRPGFETRLRCHCGTGSGSTHTRFVTCRQSMASLPHARKELGAPAVGPHGQWIVSIRLWWFGINVQLFQRFVFTKTKETQWKQRFLPGLRF